MIDLDVQKVESFAQDVVIILRGRGIVGMLLMF
jgi:hypothetical protein